MKIIQTEKSPAAIGPYSQAIVSKDMLFTSGQLGIDVRTGDLGKDISAQTHLALQNLAALVEESGFSLQNIVKTTIFLKNMSDFQTVNTVYGEVFSIHKPARSTVEVSNLPKNALIEIEAVAIK